MQSNKQILIITQRHVTLVEVIIAMLLVSILMTVLMGYYGQIEIIHGQVELARQQSFQIRYLQARLAYVLPSIIPVKAPVKQPEKKYDFYFYTSDDQDASIKGTSLVFTYDNGIDINPAFSNTVLGRLALEDQDGNGRLVLMTWPAARYAKGTFPPPMQKEVLIDRVTELTFEFFNPNPPEPPTTIDNQSTNQQQGTNTLAEDNTPKAPLNQWVSSWVLAYKDLPAIIRVTIKRSVQTGLVAKDQPIQMAFPLPNSKKPIVITQ